MSLLSLFQHNIQNIQGKLVDTGREKLVRENKHTAHKHWHTRFSLPVYWTIGPINRWLWGGHVKPSDWMKCTDCWLLGIPVHVPFCPPQFWKLSNQRRERETILLWHDLVGGHIGHMMDEWVTTSGILQPDQWGITARGGYNSDRKVVPWHSVCLYVKVQNKTMPAWIF